MYHKLKHYEEAVTAFRYLCSNWIINPLSKQTWGFCRNVEAGWEVVVYVCKVHIELHAFKHSKTH